MDFLSWKFDSNFAKMFFVEQEKLWSRDSQIVDVNQFRYKYHWKNYSVTIDDCWWWLQSSLKQFLKNNKKTALLVLKFYLWNSLI